MKKTILTLVTAFLAGIAGAAFFYFTFAPGRASVSASIQENISSVQSKEIVAAALPTGTASLPDFKEAAAKSAPAVVFIKTVSQQGRPAYTWYDYFFGGGTQREVVGSGSGVIISEDGYIVTNNHVIDEARSIEVIFNKRSYEAEIIGTDPSTDLALIKVDAKSLPAITFTSSKNLSVGEWVLAVGNPFNLNSTVTAGIVSAKGRSIDVLKGQFPIESFIQTDAAINPGNSGGALVNKEGKLVGINTAILSKTGSYVGYGFAVPADIVAKVVSDLKKYGYVQKAVLGAQVIEVDEDAAEQLGLNEVSGVALMRLYENAAADRAGLQRGDVITAIDGESINSKADYDEVMSYYKPGDRVKVKYERESKVRELELTLTNIKGTTDIIRKNVYKSEYLGTTFETISREDAKKLGIRGGVRVSDTKGGLMDKLDIPEGFVITSVNNEFITDPEIMADRLLRTRGRVVLRGVHKNGKSDVFAYEI